MTKELVQKKNFSLFDYHSQIAQEGVVVFYKGPFTDSVLADISQAIKHLSASSPHLTKKIFAVFIELAQNISYYSSEKNFIKDQSESPGVGTVIIKEYAEHFTLTTGNIIRNEEKARIASKCELINSLGREELREYKRSQRNLPPSESGGGNIGLIQVALTAGSSLDLELLAANEEYSFFALSVDINKNALDKDKKE